VSEWITAFTPGPMAWQRGDLIGVACTEDGLRAGVGGSLLIVALRDTARSGPLLRRS